MHYFTFNIGDYARRTKYLDLLEDLAYRRLLDLYYLNETPFTDTPENIARAIGMRSHCDEVAYVLETFFPGGKNRHADEEIAKYKAKSEKAKKSAEARWNKGSMRSHSKGNANQEPKNHKPIVSKGKKSKRFSPPSLQDVVDYAKERNQTIDLAKKFFEYFNTGNWKDAKGNQVKNWKQKFLTWESFNQDKKQPEVPGSASHNTYEQNQKDQEEHELKMAQRQGFKTVQEYNDWQYEQTMARFKTN